jgi:hypothetical protein
MKLAPKIANVLTMKQELAVVNTIAVANMKERFNIDKFNTTHSNIIIFNNFII